MDDLLEFLNLDGLRAPSGPHGAFDADAMDLDVAVGIDRLPSPPVLSTPLPPPAPATSAATDADLLMASSALRPSANLAIMVDGSSSSLFPPSALALPTTPVTPASSSMPVPLQHQMPQPVSRGTLFHDQLQQIRRAPMWSDDEDDDHEDDDASDRGEDMDGSDRMSPAVPPVVALPTPPRATAPQRARRDSLPSSAAEMTSRILAAIDRDHHRAHRDQRDHDALHLPTASSHGDASSSAESSPLSSAASSDMDEDEASDAPMLAINPSRLSHTAPAPVQTAPTRTARSTRSATSALTMAATEEGTLARRRRRPAPTATASASAPSTASAPTGPVRRSARAKRSNTSSTSASASAAAKSHAESAPTTATATPPPSSAAATLKRRTRSASASPKPPPATRARARPRRGATSRRTSPVRALTPVANATPGRHSASHMLARFVGRKQTLAPSVARASDSAAAAAPVPEPKVKAEEEMVIKAEPIDASDLAVAATLAPASVPSETSPATPAPSTALATASTLPSPPATVPRPTTIAAALGVGIPAPAPLTAAAPKLPHLRPAAATPDLDDHFDPDHFDDDDEHDDDMLVDPPTGHHPSLWPPKHLNTEPFDLDETAAHLTPKERRQLRNKISARNFRQRRKQYLEHLEDQVAALRIDVSHERKHRHWAVERATVLKQKVEELATELAELKGCDAKGIVDQIEAALPKGPPPPPSPKAKPTPPPSVKTVPTAAGAPYPMLAGRATTPNKLGLGKLPTPVTGGLPLPPMMPGMYPYLPAPYMLPAPSPALAAYYHHHHFAVAAAAAAQAAQAAQAAAARPEATIRVH